jgi:2-methylcitrate dehydratase PrpD
MSFTLEFSKFLEKISFADLTEENVRTTKNAFLDCIGVILAGVKEDAPRIVHDLIQTIGTGGKATILGTHQRTSAPLAALANGVAGHCLDYDDVNHPIMGHPTVVLVPAILAVAEIVPVSGQEAMVAYAAGLELAAKLGRIVNPHYYEQGWHTTSSLGIMGAAAATARLLGLGARRTTWAIGIAASQASGVRRNFGSMTKSFHAGHAAQGGLTASLLASKGFTAAEDVLEGPRGFLSLCGGASPQKIEKALQTLGRPFELSASGLVIKQYPCCAASHPVLDAVLLMREQNQERLGEIDQILCRVHPLVPHIMIHDRPKASLEGKFSLKYCVAAAIVDGKITLESFAEEAILRPEVNRWIDCIAIKADLDDEGASYGGIPTKAEVIFQWNNGSSSLHRVERPAGSPDSPLPQGVLQRKFHECASRALTREAMSRAYNTITRLETLQSLTDLIQELVPLP